MFFLVPDTREKEGKLYYTMQLEYRYQKRTVSPPAHDLSALATI
jgi:hypothetical protein